MTNVTTDAKVPTDPAFTKGAGLGKSGGDIPASASYPVERSTCIGSSKQPAFGAKTYKEFGAASPSIKQSSTEQQD